MDPQNSSEPEKPHIENEPENYINNSDNQPAPANPNIPSSNAVGTATSPKGSPQPLNTPPNSQSYSPHGSSYPVSKPNIPLITILVVIGVLMVAGIAFATYKSVTKKASDANTKTSDALSSLDFETTEERKEANIGQNLETEPFRVSVTAIEKNANLNASIPPKKGSSYYVASVEVQNTTDKEQDLSLTEIKIETTQGEIIYDEYVDAPELKRFSNALGPKGKTNGKYAFEVPDTQEIRAVYFSYTDYGTGNDFKVIKNNLVFKK